MEVRRAEAKDLEAVLALLRSCRLPVEGVPDDLAHLLVAELGGRLAGVVGLEIHGENGLLRSLAVTPEARERRLASRLCDAIEERAAALGVRELFLLTETAERFFLRRGYERLERQRAPAGIAASREFAALCPASALLMRRAITG